MKEQIIVSIGREHGSGGHAIARMLAERLSISLYDKKLVDEIIQVSGYSPELVSKMDEKPVNLLAFRRIGEYSNSLEEHVAQKTFELLKSKADSGESFVVVGRCADSVLRENPNLVSVFISGKKEDKIQRIMQYEKVSEAQAVFLIRETDRRRKLYHNYYSEHKWGDSRGYDLLINSSRFGIESTVEILYQTISHLDK